MRVVITGCNGQLGSELQELAPPSYKLTAVDIDQLDITDSRNVDAFLHSSKAQLVINAAAYTAVDKAETDQALAYAVNADGAGNLAKAAKEINARFIQISTDFIFNGEQSSPYQPQDKPDPLSVYGASKLKGEQQVLAQYPDALIIRTAWVYSRHCNNFVKTILGLMSEREQLNIVADQLGTPSWAAGLAKVIWRFAELESAQGIYHWTDAGAASWYDFAVAIQEEALSLGLLQNQCSILPINTDAYPTPAKRPVYSILDKSSCWQATQLEPQHWRVSLRAMLKQLQQAQQEKLAQGAN